MKKLFTLSVLTVTMFVSVMAQNLEMPANKRISRSMIPRPTNAVSPSRSSIEKTNGF